MVFFSQFCLLAAFCSLGYAVFGCTAGLWQERRSLLRSGEISAFFGVACLTIVTIVLARAFIEKDFHFAYVTQYSNLDLPWYYSLSAFWVGQSGSLLFWTWLLGIAAICFRFWPLSSRLKKGTGSEPSTGNPAKNGLQRRACPPFQQAVSQPSPLKKTAFAIILLYLFFLAAVLLFTADPTVASLGLPMDGMGLSPTLMHPVMLIHPPIVFLGYAIWTIPFALVMAGLIRRETDRQWICQTRSWAIFAWCLLGAGIILGGLWAYEELGWGGYWNWDPVENGSLIPWLLGTAFLHAALAWRSRGILKKTAVALAIATFAFCNFAAFITRSGFFSSLHAFNQSPLGWMFLVLMAGVAIGGAVLMSWRRTALTPEKPWSSFWAKESWIWIFSVLLILLAALAFTGTLIAPLSGIFLGKKFVVEAAYYNKAMVPIGLVLLTATALAPLLRWGASPASVQKKAILLSLATAIAGTILAFFAGIRHPIALAVAGLACFGIATFAGTLVLDVLHRTSPTIWQRLLAAVRGNRRQYAGFLIHLGFISLAVGITGSSLGAQRHEAVMHEGETYAWSGWSIRLAGLTQHDSPGKIAVEARLEISRGGRAFCILQPAQNYYRCSNEWTAQAAIHSTWTEDFFVILHSGEAGGKIYLTFVENPLMRWIWFGGCIAGLGALLGLLPSRRFAARRIFVPAPHLAASYANRRPLASRVSHG